MVPSFPLSSFVVSKTVSALIMGDTSDSTQRQVFERIFTVLCKPPVWQNKMWHGHRWPCTCCRLWPVWEERRWFALQGPSLPGLPDSCHRLHRRHGDKWSAGWMVSGKVGQRFLPLWTWSSWCTVNRPRPKICCHKTIYGPGYRDYRDYGGSQ